MAYVSGDDLPERVLNKLKSGPDHIPDYLDTTNAQVKLYHLIKSFVTDVEHRQLVSANACLGDRAIVKALKSGADIVICGRGRMHLQSWQQRGTGILGATRTRTDLPVP